MRMSREKFFASLEDEIDQETKLSTIKTLERHISGEPVAYILGYREFYGLNLMVNPDVLIPRQETELLVEAVLEISKNQVFLDPPSLRPGPSRIATVTAKFPKCVEKNKVAQKNRPFSATRWS